MKELDLVGLDLGPFDADDDQNLSEYFVSFGEFDALLAKKNLFVVGVKGSGKSAIKRYLLNSRVENQQFVIAIDDTYSVPISELETSSPAEIKNKMKGYITGIVIRYLLESDEVSTVSKGKLKRFEDSVPLIKTLLKPVKIRPPYFEIAVGELFPEDKRSGLLRVIDPSMSQAILESLAGNDLWILVDDIHRVFTSDNQELSLKFIEGLIYATSDLVVRTFQKQLHMVLFLRAEIYEELNLRASELDKELQYLWQIVWDSDELKNFLAERIRWVLNGEPDLDSWKYWKLIFNTKNKKETIDLQNYMIERLINGPRDLLLMVDLARKTAISQESRMIGLTHIQESEFEYGDEKLNQINRNFQESYEGIKQVLDYLFRKEKRIYKRGDLEQHIRKRLLIDPDALKNFDRMRWIRGCTAFHFLEILYRIGFIGYWDKTYERYVYVLEQANPDKTLVASSLFKIHSAFTRYLELSDS
jgi:hypothetical protein